MQEHTIHPIYTQTDPFKMSVARFIARVTAVVAKRPWLQKTIQNLSGTLVIDVEKDEDSYEEFYLTRLELVDRSRLSPSQKLALSKDAPYMNGTLYMATMIQAPGKKPSVSLQREFLLNDKIASSLSLALPTKGAPIGDGRKVILPYKAFILGTKGQYFGSTIPRVHTLESMAADPVHILKIEERQKSPSRKFKFGFMNAKRKTPAP